MATISQIQRKIAELQKQADVVIKKRSAMVLKIKTMLETHGLTTADIDAPAERPSKSRKASTSASKKVVATKKAVLPPKYLNPKTDQVWSGHGRPPAWIKDAKHRDKFLIDAPKKKGTSAGRATVKASALPAAAE